MRLLTIGASCLLLGACRSTPDAIPKPSPPVQVRCAAPAYERCQTSIPLWEPADPSAPDAWKAILPQVVLPMGRELANCDQRVQALQTCLDNLQRERVILWR